MLRSNATQWRLPTPLHLNSIINQFNTQQYCSDGQVMGQQTANIWMPWDSRLQGITCSVRNSGICGHFPYTCWSKASSKHIILAATDKNQPWYENACPAMGPVAEFRDAQPWPECWCLQKSWYLVVWHAPIAQMPAGTRKLNLWQPPCYHVVTSSKLNCYRSICDLVQKNLRLEGWSLRLFYHSLSSKCNMSVSMWKLLYNFIEVLLTDQLWIS